MADINGKREGAYYEFPSWESIPEETKNTPKYCIDVAKAVRSKWQRDKTAIGHTWGSFFDELREYGAGKQSPEKYKTFMSSASSTNDDQLDDAQYNSQEAARKGWWNIDFSSVVSFIPNLRSQIRGILANVDYSVVAENIDLDSGATEERKMLELYTDTHPVYGRLINDLKQSANIPIEEPSYIPEDLKELEDMKEEGAFKELYVQQHEKLLLHTENISNWERFLKNELITDTIDIGYLFAYVDFDEETSFPKWYYADPKDVVIQYDHLNGFQNSDYAQVREKWTISKLKQYKDQIYHADGHKITEEEFKKIAKEYCGIDGNPDEKEWISFNKETVNGYGYDMFKIYVDKTWWKDVEYKKYIKYYNRYGKLRMYDYKEPIEKEYDVAPGDNNFDYPYEMGDNYSLLVNPVGDTVIGNRTKKPNGFDVYAKNKGKVRAKAYINIGKDEQLNKVRIRKLYYCWHISDTDFCIKFGVMPNQPRNGMTEPLLPLVGYRYPDKSLVFRCQPIEDIYAIAYYRFQNGLAKATQGIYALNTTLLDAGGKKLDILKVIKMARENQFLPYKMNMVSVGGTPVPISYIQGNLAEVITNEVAIMDRCMKWVEDQTGFSMLALGATPKPDQPVGTTTLSLQQTQNSILPIIEALRYIKEELGKRTSVMWQLALRNDERARQNASKIIGEDGVFILRQAQSLDVQYGIRLVAKPDDKFKEAVIMSASKAAQAGRITADEELFIVEWIMYGNNPKEGRLKLRKMIQKNKKLEEMYKQQSIITQNKGLQETAAAQAQSSEKIAATQMQAKDAETRTKAQADIVVRQHDSDMNIKEMIAQKQLENGQIPQQNTQPQTNV